MNSKSMHQIITPDQGTLPILSSADFSGLGMMYAHLPLIITSVESQCLIAYAFSVQEQLKMQPIGTLDEQLQQVVTDFAKYDEIDQHEAFFSATGVFSNCNLDLMVSGTITALPPVVSLDERVQAAGENIYYRSRSFRDNVSIWYFGSMLVTMWHYEFTVPSTPLLPMVSIFGVLPVCHKGL